MLNSATLMVTLLAAIIAAGADPIAADARVAVPQQVSSVLQKYCLECHSAGTAEGGIRFDILPSSDLDLQLDLLNKAQEQLFFELMPPVDAPQPSQSDRRQLLQWMSNELQQHGGSMLEEKLQRPEYGNYVSHEDLFSGDYRNLPGFTWDRRWLISEFIFDAQLNRLIDHQGQRTIDGIQYPVTGDNGVGLGTRFGGQSLRQRITNPFLLPEEIGVRYYALGSLTSGHLLTMVSNSRKISEYMVAEPTMKAHFPAMYEVMKQELEHRETLRRRGQFLQDHIEHLLIELFPDRHEAMLPQLVRIDVPNPPQVTNRDGTPRPETNLGLLDRYDGQDLSAIYQGIGQYLSDDTTWNEVILKCERDWFMQGIHSRRLENRISIMKVLNTNWDMQLILEDVKKRNIQPPAWKPLAEAEMKEIRRTLLSQRQAGDTYQQIREKCMTHWRQQFAAERADAGQTDQSQLQPLISELFQRVLERAPTESELADSISFLLSCMNTLSTQDAIAKLVESMLLNSERVYRYEFGVGPADEHQRRMMSPRDASYALSFALTDSSPDAELVTAVIEGRLQTRDDYRREVTRMLQRRDQYYVIDETVQKGSFNSSITNTPIRKLRFFREFFGYPAAMKVFKDDARFGAGRHESAVSRLVDEADMLVDHILQRDQNVLEELLTTEEFYVFHSGNNAAMQESCDRLQTIYDYFRKLDWQNFTEAELYQHWPFIERMKMRGTVFNNFLQDDRRRSGWVGSFRQTMNSLEERLGRGQRHAMPYDEINMAYWHKGNATGRTGQVMREHQVTTYFNIDYRDWDYPPVQPTKIEHRKGMLTHPAWLIAHSLNTETDPVRRGRWIREKLLAGTVPDVPITVDAVIPEDHTRTLRQRLEERTSDSYCRSCHRKMDPLGLPFEIFDDFGRYRTQERLEHEANLITAQQQAPLVQGVQLAQYETLPVDARGTLEGTGNGTLDGDVLDAFELIDRLSEADRVRQSIIRHAFRYFLGRNETISDSNTLMQADEAYLSSGGSFDAVIISLLTSDSFIYRRPGKQQP